MIQRIRDVGGPALAVLATISFVSSLGISIMLPLLPLYGLSLGASPLQLGLMTSGFAIANGVAQFASGILMDRYGARRFIMAVLSSIPIFLFGFIVFFGLPKPFFYAISFVTGAALTAYNASWFALLTTAVPAARRGRVFGVVSAVAQAGVVVGAMGATAIWQLTDVGGGLILSSTAALGAGLVLLLLPPEVRPAASPAPRAPEASDTPASR